MENYRKYIINQINGLLKLNENVYESGVVNPLVPVVFTNVVLVSTTNYMTPVKGNVYLWAGEKSQARNRAVLSP